MSKRDFAWYEDPDLKNLYIKSASNAMRGYHAPIVHPKITFTGTNSLTDLTILLGAYLTEDEKRVLIVVDKDLRKHYCCRWRFNDGHGKSYYDLL